MRIVLFYHSVRSDWNHGNAHFLRGVATELQARQHQVTIYEPEEGWSAAHLRAEHGDAALEAYRQTYPTLDAKTYDAASPDYDRLLDGADLVLVNEWNPAALIAGIGRARREGGRFTLLFHDTHHRSVSDAKALAAVDLSDYDGVLAFGEVIRERYVRAGWARSVWTWHEAADTRIFRPHPEIARTHDVVWIGNWGDDERTTELETFLLAPARALGLSGHVHGVRYPLAGRRAVADAGLQFAGWIPNFEAPVAFARHRMTVHVPRRPYVTSLPGVPTIRVFEALACGIPLVSAPWADDEGLFEGGRDYVPVSSGDDMRRAMKRLLADPAMAAELSRHGRHTIEARHTCGHRVTELFDILRRVRPLEEVPT